MVKKLIISFLFFVISSSYASHYNRNYAQENFSELYINPEHGFVGCLASYKTFLDGEYLGKLGMRGYLQKTTYPGHHVLTLKLIQGNLDTEIILKPRYAYYFKVIQNLSYTGTDAAISAAGVIVGAKTGVGFYSPGKVSSRLVLVAVRPIG